VATSGLLFITNDGGCCARLTGVLLEVSLAALLDSIGAETAQAHAPCHQGSALGHCLSKAQSVILPIQQLFVRPRAGTLTDVLCVVLLPAGDWANQVIHPSADVTKVQICSSAHTSARSVHSQYHHASKRALPACTTPRLRALVPTCFVPMSATHRQRDLLALLKTARMIQPIAT
jgi:hypothetical protein